MRRWSTLLFPDPGPAPGSRPERWLGSAAAVIVGTVATLARAGGFRALSVLYAEDGRLFVADALADGFVRPLLRTYNGYLHLFPRLVAALATVLVPTEHIAPFVAVVTAMATAGCGVVVFFASRGLLRSPWLRGLLGGLVVLMPVAEAPGTAAYLQFILLYAAFWCVLWRPRTTGTRVVAVTVCVLAAGSSVFAVLLIPVAASRLAVTRRPGELAPGIALTAITVVHGAVALWAPNVQQWSAMDPYTAAVEYTARVPFGAITGAHGGREVLTSLGTVAVASIALAVLCLYLLGVVRGDATVRVTMAVCGVLQLVVFAVGAATRAELFVCSTPRPCLEMSFRYETAPVLFLLTGLFVWVDHLAGSWSPRWAPAAAAGVIAVVLAPGIVAGFRSPHLQAPTPTWAESVREGRRACAEGASRYSFAQPPDGDVSLPCDVLMR